MTETTMQKFDINDAADKLKGKIRDAFMELLTEDQFKAMVKAELDSLQSATGSRQASRSCAAACLKNTSRRS